MENRQPLISTAKRLARVGGAAALLAWLALAANCSGGPVGPGPVLPLTVTCPSPAPVTSPNGVTATVSFETPLATGGTPPATVACSPVSGSTFAIGTTSVVCTARDSAGQAASCSFGVTVNRPPNDVPMITALTLSANRVEVNGSVAASATVTDADSPLSAMRFEWTADRSGSFAGQGPAVTWRAPNEQTTPVDARLTVTVVEPYQIPGSPGGTAENRVSRTSDPVHIHNSVGEISSLVLKFLANFANSSVSPEVCVQDFADTCQGKEDERQQIADNRKKYRITASAFHVESVTIETPFAKASVVAPCSFTSVVLKDNSTEKVDGKCLLTAEFLQERWWLCDSNFQGSLVPAMRDFFGSHGRVDGSLTGPSTRAPF